MPKPERIRFSRRNFGDINSFFEEAEPLNTENEDDIFSLAFGKLGAIWLKGLAEYSEEDSIMFEEIKPKHLASMSEKIKDSLELDKAKVNKERARVAISFEENNDPYIRISCLDNRVQFSFNPEGSSLSGVIQKKVDGEWVDKKVLDNPIIEIGAALEIGENLCS